MSAIGKILTGIIIGFILSIILGSVFLQGVLFQQGADMLGVGTWGMYYFVGGFIASCVLMCFPGSRKRVSLIGLYAVAVILVGSIALNSHFTEIAGTGTGSDELVERFAFNVDQMAYFISQVVFWATPTLVTFIYACLYYAHVTAPTDEQKATQP